MLRHKKHLNAAADSKIGVKGHQTNSIQSLKNRNFFKDFNFHAQDLQDPSTD